MPETTPIEQHDSRTPWASDDKAKKEVRDWERLDEIEDGNHKHRLAVIKHFGWIQVSLMWLFSLGFAAALIVWLWHFITPWKWLEESQLSTIQSVILSGGIGSFVTAMAQKNIK